MNCYGTVSNNASFFHFQTSSTVTSWNLWISKSNTQKIKNSKITNKKGTNNYKTLNISTPPPKPTMGSTTQKYSLKWNDFTVNVASTFRDLHSRHDFVDVTLACADGSTLEAHKVILSSVSSYFRDILKVSALIEIDHVDWSDLALQLTTSFLIFLDHSLQTPYHHLERYWKGRSLCYAGVRLHRWSQRCSGFAPIPIAHS